MPMKKRVHSAGGERQCDDQIAASAPTEALATA
jgi:hypothetical protein